METSTELSEEEFIVNDMKVAMHSPGLARLRQKLGDKARKEPKFRFYSLYGHIHHIETLRTAWKLIRNHGQTPGIDGVTYADIENVKDIKDPYVAAVIAEQNVEAYLRRIQTELRNKTYKPQAIRRTYIPKDNGEKRPLGIPTIDDRIVQMAVLLIIEPIFEADFMECSYGFRPKRSAHEAIQEIARNLKDGKTTVYDADLKGYFDSIPHEKLLKCIKMRITDSTLLKLIEGWLKAPIVEEEKDDEGNWKIKVTKPDRGTPQGGVISPILANIYLHWFDKRFYEEGSAGRKANAKLIRYADDFVIMAKDIGHTIKDSIKYLIEDWLNLEINKEKTHTITLKDRGDSVDFLGYTFRLERSHYNCQNYVRIEPKKKAIKKAVEKVKQLTNRNRNDVPLDIFIGDINRFLIGWRNYFKLGHPDKVFKKMDHYVRKKIETHLNKRSQRSHSKPKDLTWYNYLTKRLGLTRLYDKKRRLKPSN